MAWKDLINKTLITCYKKSFQIWSFSFQHREEEDMTRMKAILISLQRSILTLQDFTTVHGINCLADKLFCLDQQNATKGR